ncbi:MAG: VirE protein, partial [Bacteroidaceae bacterium]|nr:VirE protein [Bacteroidaceae bacterium]
LFRHGSHGFHGTHPLPNEADAHLEDADNAQAVKESVSSNQPKATETQGHEKPCDPCHPCQKEEFPQAYEGISYETIVETLEEQMGGQPEHGSRNNFIFSMACHLRYICNDDPDWIAQVMPDYGEARSKWMASIRSACNRNQTKAMPRIMKRTIAICKQRIEENSELETHNSELENTPPAMPKRLPPLIKLLVSRTPDIYKPAVAHAVFPALATHLWKVRFRYIDNVEHEATLMNVLMAGTGAGKDCISAPINYIMADIRKRDRENMLREKEWKKEMNTKGANKDKRDRPQGLVIQEIDADMTNPAFCMRTNEAEEHFLYTKMNEIDQFDALKGNGKNGGQQFQIMCLAFDPGNLYGQTRASAQSVSERVTIRFNWNASTTILKGQRYFRNVLTDGPISRINFCTIPEREIGADIPVYGSYDAAFEEELRPYIEHLTHATGLIECKQAFSLARKLKDENAEKSRLTQSRVFENLSFRANVIAYLKAMVLYVAHGYRWDKTMEDFVRWSLQYDLWCKMEFFGAAIEEAMQGAVKRRTPGRQNLLELLGNEFTLRDAENVRVKQGMDTKGTRNMLNQWKHRGYILQMTNDNYKKSENYKTK